MGRWVDLVAPNDLHPQKAPITIPGPAPEYGARTRNILADAGYDTKQIDAMIGAGEAGESWSTMYLPE